MNDFFKYILILSIIFQPSMGGTALMGSRGGLSAQGFGMFRRQQSGPTSQQTIFLTSTAATTWTVPTDWNSANNRIEVIGGGGGGTGNCSGADTQTAGGGGGAYAVFQNLTLTPGATINIKIGSGGAGGTSGTPAGGNGGDSWFNGANCAASSICAKGGSGGNLASQGGAGGSASNSIGQITFSGGRGGNASNLSWPGAGGGGAGGPFGVGGNGGDETYGSNANVGAPGGGAGGGGASGESATNNTTNAEDGGNNSSGIGAGIGGTGGASATAGTAGTGGGGGGGGGHSTSSSGSATGGLGGAGGNGTEWDSSYGSGGGGGGGGGAHSGSAKGAAGGNGGLYGGGGGGGGCGIGGHGNGGSGAQGIVMVTYGPSVPSTKVVTLTSGSSWTVPSDWNSTGNTIECIGGGGGGGNYSTHNGGAGDGGGGGAGGGAYAKIFNLSLTPGASVSYQIGAGGGDEVNGGDSWFGSTGTVLAKGGQRGLNQTKGLGGSAASSVGTIKYSGGNGEDSGPATGGGGGGGAGGPNGAGGSGSWGYYTEWTGGGGGGNGGGTDAADALTGQGGAGGNNHLGTGGGAPGTDSSSLSASVGVNGGGGGGSTHDSPNDGAPGGASNDISTSPFVIGSGGGGGGSGAWDEGGPGGNFGGGGGGGAYGGGKGGNGVCVVKYSNLPNNLGSFSISGITGGADTTADATLDAPTNTSPAVTWSASANASAYKVTILADDNSTVVCPEQISLSTSYSFSSCPLTDATHYRAQVKALNLTGELAASNSTYRFLADYYPMITYVKDTPLVGNAEATSHTATFSTLPSSGNTILVYAATWSANIHNMRPTSVTDNNGNTYLQACKHTLSSGGEHQTAIFYARNITVNQPTFTITIAPGASAEMLMRGIEYSGLSTTSPLDQTAGNCSTSATSSPTSGTTATTTTALQLLAGVLDLKSGGGITITPTNSFTSRGFTSGGTNPMGGFADRVVTSTGPYAATWSLSSSSEYSSCIATFSATATSNSCPGGFVSGGYCYYDGVAGASCDTTCASYGKSCSLAGTQAASASGTVCSNILDALGRIAGTAGSGSYAYGCSINASNAVRFHSTASSVTCAATNASWQRVCACQ